MSRPGAAPSGVPFAVRLRDHGDRPAVVTDAETWTHRQLADLAGEATDRLGPTPRLVLLAPTDDVASVATLLGALAGGHPVLLVPPDGPADDDLIARYDPDVVVTGHPGGADWVVRREGTAHDLHPDLAVLLSTSGSTGSPKLVRLSADNLQSNATAIAEALGLRADDRAITSLPMHYCYGLSVLTSHLAVGGSISLTRASVVDPCFRDRLTRDGVTTLAGVPHTFDLLERTGFAALDLPALRRVTQAGGGLAADRVTRWADLGTRRGWDFYVMYGQTEATARMAVLPPHLTHRHPGSIGRPLPGGSFRLDADGELIYQGPNVMMGYAHEPADLSRGAELGALRTGDLAREVGDGCYELVGRRSRFVKPFGLRVDLDELERRFERLGVAALAAGDDDHIVVGIAAPADLAAARDRVVEWTGLPVAVVTAVELDDLPRLPSGKPDRAGLSARVPSPTPSPEVDDPAAASTDERLAAVRAAFATVTGRRAGQVGDDATFAGLGGDSLSYVEVSIRLESILGELPADWHLRQARELVEAAPPRRTRRRRLARVETGVTLRAVAMVLIVGTHIGIYELRGGAHVLLALAGYNFARFQLGGGASPRRMAASIARMAVPTMAWIAALAVVAEERGPWDLFLLNNVLGDHAWGPRWHFWYVEVLVQVLVVAAVAFTVPTVRRTERRHPLGLPLGLLAVAVVPTWAWVGLADTSRHLGRTHLVVWLFVLGWAAQRARTPAARLAVTALGALAVPGFFDDPRRDAAVAVGLVLLVWVPSLPVPRTLLRPLGAVAAASLAIYLIQWQVYPVVDDHLGPLAALAATLAAGVAVWALGRRLGPLVTVAARWIRSRDPATSSHGRGEPVAPGPRWSRSSSSPSWRSAPSRP